MKYSEYPIQMWNYLLGAVVNQPSSWEWEFEKCVHVSKKSKFCGCSPWGRGANSFLRESVQIPRLLSCGWHAFSASLLIIN